MEIAVDYYSPFDCPKCREKFGSPQAKIFHECPGPPVKICSTCHLTLPCECED